MAEWIRALVLQSGGSGCKAFTPPLTGFVSRKSRVLIPSYEVGQRKSLSDLVAQSAE